MFFDDADDPAIAVARRIGDDRIILSERGPELDAGWRKCVVRPGLVPDGVHRFGAGTYLQSGESTPPSAPGAQGERVIGDCRILHYACCGYSSFVDKYRILGRFDDRWFGRVDIRQSIGEFHRAARDAVASGDESRAQRFYREHAMLDDMAAIGALIEAGLLLRIDAPAAWLDGRTPALP